MSIGAHGSGSGAAGKVWYLGGRQTSLILRDWSAGAWVFQGFTRRPSPFEGPAFGAVGKTIAPTRRFRPVLTLTLPLRQPQAKLPVNSHSAQSLERFALCWHQSRPALLSGALWCSTLSPGSSSGSGSLSHSLSPIWYAQAPATKSFDLASQLLFSSSTHSSILVTINNHPSHS